MNDMPHGVLRRKTKTKKAHSKVARRLGVTFSHNVVPFENSDGRRVIAGAAGDFGLPGGTRQIKLIEFSAKAVKGKMVVGNHLHLGDSGQWEFILVLGGEKKPSFKFRYKNYGGKVRERKLRGGDMVRVPPGCALGLVALKPNARVIEISNKEYDPKNYEKVKLF